MTRLKILAVLGALLVGGCAGCDWRPGPGPQPGPDAGPLPVPDGGWIDPWADAGEDAGPVDAGPQECVAPLDQCDRAGCQLAKLGCPERATPNGTPFTAACHDALLDGRIWPTACIVQAPTCEAARACR